MSSHSQSMESKGLATMSIFTESTSCLKKRQLITFKMLAAAPGWKYTEKDLVEKIDFVITDNTSHNLGVINELCDDIGTDSVPEWLICHAHPRTMFQRKTKSVW